MIQKVDFYLERYFNENINYFNKFFNYLIEDIWNNKLIIVFL